MPINANIPLSYQKPKFMNAGDVMSLKDLATRAQMNEFQLKEAQRQQEEEAGIRQDLGMEGAIDPSTGILSPQGLAAVTKRSPKQGQQMAQQRQIALSQIQQMQANQSTIQTNQLKLSQEREGVKNKLTEKALAAYDLALSRKTSPQEAERIYRQTMVSAIDELEKSGQASLLGMTPEEIAQARINIPKPDQARAQAVPLKDIQGTLNVQADNARAKEAAARDQARLEMQAKKDEEAARRTAATEARQEAAALRGERALENQERRLDIMDKKMADKPMTEYQGKSYTFGTRAAEAHQILNGLEEDINLTGLAAKQGVQGIPGVNMIGNALLSAEQQKVDQAQRNFTNATLRQESGAVIGPSEFKSAQQQYFPQPGDSKEVIEQKRKNRQTVIQGFAKQAGSGGADISAIMEGGVADKDSGAIVKKAPAGASQNATELAGKAVDQPKAALSDEETILEEYKKGKKTKKWLEDELYKLYTKPK